MRRGWMKRDAAGRREEKRKSESAATARPQFEFGCVSHTPSPTKPLFGVKINVNTGANKAVASARRVIVMRFTRHPELFHYVAMRGD